jgi:hypothetical protein
MPTYEFVDPASGERVEEWFPSPRDIQWLERAGKKYRRVAAPARFHAKRETPSPIDMPTQVIKRYRQLEEANRLRGNKNSIKEKIIQIWSNHT